VAVGGPTAKVWRIEHNGQWTRQVAVKGKLKTDAKGKLSKEQLKALAGDLAKQDFKSLPRRQGYEMQALDEVYL
jgi:hypothetical protein